MGKKWLVTELVTMLVIDGKKGESQGRIKDIRKPAILCGLRVSLVEVTGFEPATFWSRTNKPIFLFLIYINRFSSSFAFLTTVLTT